MPAPHLLSNEACTTIRQAVEEGTLVINARDIDALTYPEETVNPRCREALEKLAAHGVPLACYSAWSKDEVVASGGTFFTHFADHEGKYLYIGEDRRRLQNFDTDFLDGPIRMFVEEHPDTDMYVDSVHRRVVYFEPSRELLDKQKELNGKCKVLMESLVADDDQFVVDAYDEGLGVFRKLIFAFNAANAVLGWQDKIHLLITNTLGEQSLREGAKVTISVNDQVQDANGVADILEWIVSLYEELPITP